MSPDLKWLFLLKIECYGLKGLSDDLICSVAGWMQYGGGRNIKPGQKLETEEEKIARETKTKKLLDDYKKKLGLDMAPKDRARCERVSPAFSFVQLQTVNLFIALSLSTY